MKQEEHERLLNAAVEAALLAQGAEFSKTLATQEAYWRGRITSMTRLMQVQGAGGAGRPPGRATLGHLLKDLGGEFQQSLTDEQLHHIKTGLLNFVMDLRAMSLDSGWSDEFGWRWWILDPQSGHLMSPFRRMVWTSSEMTAENWVKPMAGPMLDANGDKIVSANSYGVVRNQPGLHARLVPHNWRQAYCRDVHTASPWYYCRDNSPNWTIPAFHPPVITGIVERFGEAVVGEFGWRSQWAVIREVHCHNQRMAEHISRIYPEVSVSHTHAGGNPDEYR